MKATLKLILLCLLATIYASCNRPKTFLIGVSQCSSDNWRSKQNDEMLTASYLYPNVRMKVLTAHDNSDLQNKQIDSLIDEGANLIVVAPNQYYAVTKAINRAWSKGIPVVLIDRKTDSGRYSAFIGADNIGIGKAAGNYIAQLTNGQAHVLEITGLSNSSPASERDEGFTKAIERHPDMKIVDRIHADWTRKGAEAATRIYVEQHPEITFDCVFAQNDRMAEGARDVLGTVWKGNPVRYCGVDALPGKDGGIDLVKQGKLTFSCIYPTRGDKVMELAMNILLHKPYKKDNLLRSSIVNQENADIMMMQAEEMSSQHEQLQKLHNELDLYLAKISHQRVYTILCSVILLLIVVIFIIIYRLTVMRHRMVVNDIQAQLKHYTDQNHLQKHIEQEQESQLKATNNTFMDRLFDSIIKNMADSELSVETLAAEMGLSRVQLYRKVKEKTGSSPVEIIRITRLNKAEEYLKDNSRTIAEVAYSVGFSSPSYFTRCYKSYYGHLPRK